MTDRRGSRGGSIHSLDEARAVHDLTKKREVARVDAAIWAVLRRKGTVHANDLIDVEIGELDVNIIGNRIGLFGRRKWTRKIGWAKTTNPASHGREARIWELTDLGRAAMPDVGDGGAGRVEGPRPVATVSGGGSNVQTQPSRSSVSDPPPDSEPEQLSIHVDVPQAATARASYEDPDLGEAA